MYNLKKLSDLFGYNNKRVRINDRKQKSAVERIRGVP